MVVFIADEPNEYSLASQEDKIFYKLKENLPKDEDDVYYVFHSLRVSNVVNNTFRPKEIDFVIFNPQKGIICIEAKAGEVSHDMNGWKYGKGIPIDKGGPYRQAERKKINILERFDKANCAQLKQKCVIHHAVWFVSLTKEQINSSKLPPDAPKELTLTKNDLDNPVEPLDRIFNIKLENTNIRTSLTKLESECILSNVLCPEFHLVPTMASERSLKRSSMERLLVEQAKILDFLDEQPTATINGAGGTGKTMIALEKARRHANNGERVLFLCYNKGLCQYLKDKYSNPNIDIYNIDAFACSYCKVGIPDYKLLKEKLEEDYLNQTFPYKHIIIDEGQDFGQREIEKNDILYTFESVTVDKNGNSSGSFYIFYDKQQFIQGEQCPAYINNSDFRLTLKKNCRNTKNIADTSSRPLKLERNKTIMTKNDAITGDTAVVYVTEDKNKSLDYLNLAIKECLNNKIDSEEIVIISCKTKEDIGKKHSILAEYDKVFPAFNRNFKITNCTDFKGLEADAVILIDIDKDTFSTAKNCNRFYVGASRAKFNLYMICNLSLDECAYFAQVIKTRKDGAEVPIQNNIIKRSPEKIFAASLNSTLFK